MPTGSVGAVLDATSPPPIPSAIVSKITIMYQPSISTNYVPGLNAYVAIYKVSNVLFSRQQ